MRADIVDGLLKLGQKINLECLMLPLLLNLAIFSWMK